MPDGFPGGGDFSPPEGFDASEGFGGKGGFPGGGGFGMGSSDVKLQYTDDDPDSYSNIFDSAKTTVTGADKARLIESLKQLGEGTNLEEVLDIDEVLRYFVVHNFVVNGDSYTGTMIHNYYLHEEDGRLSMIPWDYNLAFGTFQASDADSAVNDPIDSPLSVSGDGSRPMADWIFRNEEYTELYHQYFAEFLDEIDMAAMIDETYELIAPYVGKDPTAFCTYEEFELGVSTLKTFCELRTQSVRGQLDGTIPSTDEGQRADDSALIDASAITLSDLGAFGGGGGFGGFGGGPDSGERPQPGSFEGFGGSGERPAMGGFGEGGPPSWGGSGGSQDGSGGGEQPADGERPSFGGARPSDMGGGFGGPRDSGSTDPAADAGAYLMIGVSAAVLAAGVAFAVLYRKRR